MHTYILLFQCKDREGIVAKISDLIFKNKGNIISLDQYTTDPKGGYFFMRVEFLTSISKQTLESKLSLVAKGFKAEAKLYDKYHMPHMGIFVSRPDHCLYHLLYLWKSGELKVKIPFVVSNYKEHKNMVERYGIPFYYIGATKRNREEKRLLAAARGADFLVLARYMLVLSKDFLASYGKDIINIHHGFLPSFKGGNPYKQALDKGVKVLGATAHFVTEKLDDGPIIAQSVEYISHKDDLASLIRKGKHLENRAFSDAVISYVDHRVIRHGNNTIVF